MDKLRQKTVALALTISFSCAVFFYTQKERFYPEPEVVVEQTAMAESTSNDEAIPEVQDKEIQLIVERGDTINRVLLRAGISKDDAQTIITAIKKKIDPRDLKVGQILNAHVRQDGQTTVLLGLSYKPSAEEEFSLKNEDGTYEASLTKVALRKVTRHVDGTVGSSFYGAAQKRGVPANIVREAIKALSYDVNWQHEPKSGDAFEMVYDVYEDDKGEVVKQGDLQYVAFAPAGKLRRVYRYKSGAEPVGYYNPQGESFAKGFLKTPLDSTKIRITSKFSKSRKHPILGYCRAHKGVDYGAPTGTAVYAAGDGQVVEAKYHPGGYGKYVKIRHAGGYQTVYAHLSRISVKTGQGVRQGQVVGNVGMTGLASGPHLHHEVIYNGQHVDPQKVVPKLPAQKLMGRDHSAFMEFRKKIDHYVRGVAPETHATLRPAVSIQEGN